MVQQAFRVDNLSTSNIEFKANSFVSSLVANTALASNVHLVLPGSVGTSGQVLATDGSGNLSFINQSAGDTIQDNVNATNANVNLVQNNVTSLTSTVDSFGVYANTSFGFAYSTTLYSNLSAGITTFNANSTPALTTYTAGKIGVYRNGVKLPSTDYTASDGTSLTLNNATLLGDSIEVVNFGTDSYSTTLYSNLAAGTTTFNAASTPALATYTAGKIGVYRNGVKLPSTDYTASDGTSLILNNATLLGDNIEVVSFKTLSLALDDITDVDLTTNSPANGQALVYVSANSKWEPGTVASSYGNSDSAANDYTTYTTVTANLYNTYTSLLSDVNLVQDNVTSLTFTVDSADANLYNTYITVTGLIDTVQANVTSLPNSAASVWSNVSSNVTAAAGDKLFVDTSVNPITITLPAAPAFGSEIRVIDIKGTSANNKITLDNNGNNIEGVTDSLEVNINRAAFGLVFYDATEGWVFIEK